MSSLPRTRFIESPRLVLLVIVCLTLIMPSIMLVERLVNVLRVATTWEFVGRHLNDIYFGAEVVTVVSCFIYGLVILVLGSRTVATERWSNYLSAAFLVMVFQYLAAFMLDAFQLPFGQANVADVVTPALSALSNLLLVSAGLILLDRAPLPLWNLIMQGASFVIGVIPVLLDARCRRFPDALASAFCVFWIGYAMYRNIRFTNSRFPAAVRTIGGYAVLGSVLLYASLGLVFAATPYLARLPVNLPFINSMEAAVKGEPPQRIKAAVSQRLLPDKKSAQEEAAEFKISIRQMWLDATLIWIFCALKLVIFVAALFLLLGAVIFLSSHHANKIFDPIFYSTSEFLTHSGFPRVLATTLDAEAALLYVKIPGQAKNQYGRFSWPFAHKNPDLADKLSEAEVGEVNELALKAMRTGAEQRVSQRDRERTPLARYALLPHTNELPVEVAIPVIFHGAAVGCVLVASKPGRTFSPREIQHIRQLTKLATLSVQTFREHAALDQLNFRFSRVLTPTPVKDFAAAIDNLVVILHDVLTPLATGIWLDIGLKQYDSLAGEGDYCRRLRAEVEGSEERPLAAAEQGDDSYRALVIDLEVKPSNEPNSQSYNIGKLAILVPAHRDEIKQPVLGRNQIHFTVVNARTISLVLGIVMEYLNSVIQDFGVEVNKLERLNIDDWFHEIEETAREVGLEWIVIELSRESRLLGKPAAIEALRRLQSQNGTEDDVYLKSTPLRYTGGQMYVAVRGGKYNNGKNVCRLWRSSFTRFAEIADLASNRILQQQEKIKYQERQDALSYEFATIAVTTGEIVHQIVNTTRDISLPLQVIHDELRTGGITCTDRRVEKLINSLPKSAGYLLEMTADFRKLGDPRENLSCNLRQVAEQTERVMALPITQRRIILEIEIAENLTIGVPPHVAVLALATLVGNAKDAVASGGYIRITACEEDGAIRCDVTDNGTGVAPEVAPRLFRERNVTTKANGNGWGLYLVSRALQVRQGSIVLTAPGPGTTIFTIRFPKNNGGGEVRRQNGRADYFDH